MKTLVPVAAVFLLLSCSIPETGVDGRETDPGDEILVVHSMAQTLSSISIGTDGSPGVVDNDVEYLGAAANDIIQLRDRYVVTLSGENALLFLAGDTLSVVGRIDLGAGRNPMESAVISSGTGEEIVATTEFLTGTVAIHRCGAPVPPNDSELAVLPVGSASPQALIVLPGSTESERRIVVANTAFRLDSETGRPFGAASLSVRTVTIDSEEPSVTVIRDSEIPLEADDFDETTENGLNPVAFVDLPSVNELVIIGSGRNYGETGTGDDDGEVVILDRESLDITERIPVGGSPGAGALIERDGIFYLYLTGVADIRRTRRDGRWDEEATVVYEAEYSASGGASLPFLSDIVAAGEYLYVADFSRSLVLVFSVGSDGEITEESPIPVSHGPIALLVDRS